MGGRGAGPHGAVAARHLDHGGAGGPQAIKETGYPWTRPGYTCNWDPEAASPAGAQEYVVPAGAPVTVTAVMTPESYCTP